jgi:hypothetical protein
MLLRQGLGIFLRNPRRLIRMLILFIRTLSRFKMHGFLEFVMAMDSMGTMHLHMWKGSCLLISRSLTNLQLRIKGLLRLKEDYQLNHRKRKLIQEEYHLFKVKTKSFKKITSSPLTLTCLVKIKSRNTVSLVKVFSKHLSIWREGHSTSTTPAPL